MCAVPASVKREQPFQHGCGIGIYGPAIDDYGNSMTGGMLLKHIAREWDLSIFKITKRGESMQQFLQEVIGVTNDFLWSKLLIIMLLASGLFLLLNLSSFKFAC